MIKIKKYQIEDYISDATQSALNLKADLVDGKVPESQLPAFVNDVIEVANYAALPDPGTSGIIYITIDNNKLYRWGGSAYTEIASGVTNLSYTPGVSNGVVNSDTGTDATIPLADTTNAGLFSAAEKSKLEGLNPQNLQEVTDEGAITTNTITVDSVNYYSLIEPQDIGTENKITGSYAFLGGDGVVGISNGTSESEIKNTNVTNGGVILEFPDKVGGGYTIATTEDYNLQSVLDNGNTAYEQEIHLVSSTGNNTLTLDVSASDSATRAIKVDYSYIGDQASTAVQFTSNGTENPDEPGTGKTLEVNNTSNGNAIEAYSLNGKSIVTYNSDGTSIEANLGMYNDGLVINSGTSSTGVPLTINKNGVDKLVINQAGELTAQKLIKEGGTSSQFLMADGSVTTSSGGTTNLSYTASPTNGVVNSSTGTGATIPLATATNAGLLKPANFTVLENTSGTNTGDQDLSGLVVKNAAITGATKTKITYDTKGLVTAGADATTADIADSTDKRYQTDNQKLYNDATSSIQTQLNAKVSGVTATSPITSSGGTSPVISTTMATNKLIGRSTAGTGVMEEITVGSGLTLSAGTLTNTATPTPTGYYGAFQDVTNQTAAAINTGYPMKVGVTDLSNGVTVVSNSMITIANTGIYNIQWSAQFTNPTSSEHDVTIWLRKNGTDVPGSSGVVLVPPKHGSDDGHILPSWNFLLDIVAGDYYEFVWSTVNTSVYISFSPAGNPPPSTASVVMTVTQQSGIMAGTGITGIGTSGNIQTGTTQTLATNGGGTDFNIVSSGNTHTFNLPSASATARGVVTTGTQTFAGAKTFSSNPKIPVNGDNSGVGALVIENGTGQIEVATNYIYPNLTEIQTVKGVTGSIQTQFSGKVSTNTAITGATNTKITYDSKGLVTAGTTLIASDIPNISQLQVTNLTSDLGLKQNKSLSAYSMVANNTASTASATEFTFRKFDQATYGGTPAWVGTSAPTTITAQSYSGQQVGNMVSINLSVVYTNAGIANTQVTLPLPSNFPTPVSPTGFTGTLDVIAYGTGQIMANTAQTVATGARGCFLRRNAANNGYEFFLNVSVATAAKVVMLNLTYQTS